MDFSTLGLEKLRKDSEQIKPPQDARGKSYLHSYQSILAHFETLRKNPITEDQFIVACHIVYGWMPKVLTIYEPHVERAVAVLNKAREGTELDAEDFEVLKSAVNNSMVGVSKLLHFLSPDKYAIWDSKVCSYIFGKKAYTQVNNPEYYHQYTCRIRELVDESGYQQLHDRVLDILNYEVTRLRSIELIMFNARLDSR